MSSSIVAQSPPTNHSFVPAITVDADSKGLLAEDVLVQVTNAYLNEIWSDVGTPNQPTPAVIKDELIRRVNNEFGILNVDAKGPDRIPRLKSLAPLQIAMLLTALHRVIRVMPVGRPADRDRPLLAIYVDDPVSPDYGTYSTSELDMYAVACKYSLTLDDRGWKQVHTTLSVHAPSRTQCVNPDYVAVNNGVFDYSTKTMYSFDPDLVFLNKVRTTYNEKAVSPKITGPDGTDWDVDSWIAELSDDPEVVHLLWELIGAVVRPHVRWNKAAFLSNQSGSNGKGTYVSLMQNLLGVGGYISMPIVNFSKEFLLEPLLAGGPILTHENPVGAFASEADAFKCVVTNDDFTINRKNRPPVQHQHWGFMVQCVNGLPKFKDRSESLLRRILPVPFDKRFIGSTERREIKDDYLTRPEVLEYVLKRVLHDMPAFYSLSEPASCVALLGELRENNDPVTEFWAEHEDVFVWDLLPFAFLYDVYTAWFRKTNPSGTIISARSFTDSLMPLVETSQIWQCENKRKQIRTGKRMSQPERLIAVYGLNDWKDPSYTGSDPDKMSIPAAASQYRGLERIPGSNPPGASAGGPATDYDLTA